MMFQPQYVTMPGWQSSIEDVREYNVLPPNAKSYVEKIQELVQVPGKNRLYFSLTLWHLSFQDPLKIGFH